MNDLDDLERELGPALRSTFRACLADPDVQRPPSTARGREVHPIALPINGSTNTVDWRRRGAEFDLASTGDRTVQHGRKPRRRLIAAAAIALMLAGIIGVWAGANRPGAQSPPPAQQPTSEPPSEPTLPADRAGGADPAPSGAMVLDQFPAALANATGFAYLGTVAGSQPVLTSSTWIQRWYTATMDRPELQPRLKLASTSMAQQYPPQVPPVGVEAERVTAQGAPAWLYDGPADNGRTIAFRDDQTIFVLTGYQLGDDELIRAADHTMLADGGVGAVIESGGLPAGLVERAVGTTSEEPFVPLDSLQYPTPSVRWYNVRPDGALPRDDEPMLWLGWRIEDPDLFPLHRLDYDKVSDTTVHGNQAFVATNEDPEYLGVVWSESGYTYTLGGWGLAPDTVIDAANQLRPATVAEWAELEAEPD